MDEKDEKGNRKRKREEKETVVTIQVVSPYCECSRTPKSPKIIIETSGVREYKRQLSECETCHRTPCLAIIERGLIDSASGKSNKGKRFSLYQNFASLFGYRQREPLPGCLERAIKKAWPEESSNYVGFKKK